MLTCREVTELAGRVSELSLWQRVLYRIHVGLCHDCGAFLHQMEVSRATIGRLPSAPMPADARDQTLGRFRDWKGGADVAPREPGGEDGR